MHKVRIQSIVDATVKIIHIGVSETYDFALSLLSDHTEKER